MTQQMLKAEANNLLREAGFWQNQDPRQAAFEKRLILTPTGGSPRSGRIIIRRPN